MQPESSVSAAAAVTGGWGKNASSSVELAAVVAKDRRSCRRRYADHGRGPPCPAAREPRLAIFAIVADRHWLAESVIGGRLERVDVERRERTVLDLEHRSHVHAARPAHEEVARAESEPVAPQGPLVAYVDLEPALRIGDVARAVPGAERATARPHREIAEPAAGGEPDQDGSTVAAASHAGHESSCGMDSSLPGRGAPAHTRGTGWRTWIIQNTDNQRSDIE